jgi:hypothetical protein
VPETIVYNTTGSLTPKQRLRRLINGLLAQLHQSRPELSSTEMLTGLGLALAVNRRQLVNQTIAQLEKR